MPKIAYLTVCLLVRNWSVRLGGVFVSALIVATVFFALCMFFMVLLTKSLSVIFGCGTVVFVLGFAGTIVAYLLPSDEIVEWLLPKMRRARAARLANLAGFKNAMVEAGL